MRCHVNTGTPGKQIPVLGRDPHREMCDQRAVDLSHTNTCWETHQSVSKDPGPCFGSSWTLIGWWAGAVSSSSLTIYLMTHMVKYDALSSTHTHTNLTAWMIWSDTQLPSVCKVLETASLDMWLYWLVKAEKGACSQCERCNKIKYKMHQVTSAKGIVSSNVLIFTSTHRRR